MFNQWLPWISELGNWAYVLLFAFAFAESIAVVGLLVPGATFVVLFGFVISQGIYDLGDAILVGAVGAIFGDIFSFVLGRRGIDPAKRFPRLFSQTTVDRAEKFMHEYGIAGVFLGRFIGPLRPFVPFVAGALKMSWRRFMIMNISSAILWAAAYLAIGFFFGQFWSSIHRSLLWIGIGLFSIIVVYIALRMIAAGRGKTAWEEVLEQNLRDIITKAFRIDVSHPSMIVFDEHSPLSTRLSKAYRAVLTNAIVINFDETTPELVRAAIDTLAPGSLVVLVQSGSFRLNEFRFRLELFNRNLAVIEHPHLGRMPEEEHEIYLDSLAYDEHYYHTVGPWLKEKIDNAKQIIVSCEGTELIYDGPFESAKLNTGDYTGMKNTGGMFPIGEVFTEAADFSKANGFVKLFAYADADFHVIVPPEPVTVRIENGILVEAIDPPDSFTAVLDQIRADELLWVRELGFGMNRAMTKHRRLTDIGSYERMCGIHLSLGQKHSVYTKEGFPKRSSKYHVDVFADITTVSIDGEIVFKDGGYTKT